MTKYAANVVMLATKISLMNELAGLAEHLGADIEQVRRGIGADPRIGYAFIYPGCGYGGSCFPKDVRALEYSARHHRYEAPLLAAVEVVNSCQKQVLEHKLLAALGGRPARRPDRRLGPGLQAQHRRHAGSPQPGAHVQAYDPAAMDETRRIYGECANLQLCADPYSACHSADALVICTEWHMFHSPDFAYIMELLHRPLIIDGRNFYDHAKLRQEGFEYHCIGRPIRSATQTL